MSVSQNFENSQLKQQLLLEMWKKKNMHFFSHQIFLSQIIGHMDTWTQGYLAIP